MSNTENNKRIAKNTIMLYLRLFLTMGVSLYTSRVVLNTLGVADFGVYNVVGCIVTMFSFLNVAMASATQRFLSVEIGRNDILQLKKVFSTSLSIHILISFVIVLLAETVGLWFLNTQMKIPAERVNAAFWVYQFSIMAFAVSVIQVPYNASVIAHEKMNVYAYVGIAEVIMRLAIVFILVWLGFDKLILYSILTFSVSVIVFIIYRSYCKRKYEECYFHFYKDRVLFKSLLNFSFWSLFGSLAWVMMGEGLNILLNIFFGTAVNASRGIAFQVNGAVSTFVNSFRTAVNPQIVKSCTTGDKEYMTSLVFESAKYSFFLLLLLTLPILLETNLILRIWLKIVPEYSIYFCQLVLINTLIQCFDVGIVFTALGKIKQNQLIGGLIYLLIVPVSYIFLKLGYLPETVFYVQISATIFVVFGVNVYLLKIIGNIQPMFYIKKLLLPAVKVGLIACALPIFVKFIMPDGVERLIYILSTSSLSIIITVYFIGMNKNTRYNLKNALVTKLSSYR